MSEELFGLSVPNFRPAVGFNYDIRLPQVRIGYGKADVGLWLVAVNTRWLTVALIMVLRSSRRVWLEMCNDEFQVLGPLMEIRHDPVLLSWWRMVNFTCLPALHLLPTQLQSGEYTYHNEYL